MQHGIHAGWLIDGSGGPVRENVLLTVENGILADQATRNGRAQPERTINLSHCTLVPPLIDSCIHLCFSGTIDRQVRAKQERQTYSDAKVAIKRHLDDAFSHGIFAVRDCSQQEEMIHRFRTEQQEHQNGPPVEIRTGTVCSLPQEFWTATAGDKATMAHDYPFWSPLLLAHNASEQTGVPSDAVFTDLGLHSSTSVLQLQRVSQAREAGIQLVVGTGAGASGVLHGESMVSELKLLMKAGLSLVEAIACATANNARLLGMDQTLGAIAVGKPAHFLVARGTPAQLPRKLAYLEAIYMYGQPCPAQYYRKV